MSSMRRMKGALGPVLAIAMALSATSTASAHEGIHNDIPDGQGITILDSGTDVLASWSDVSVTTTSETRPCGTSNNLAKNGQAPKSKTQTVTVTNETTYESLQDWAIWQAGNSSQTHTSRLAAYTVTVSSTTTTATGDWGPCK